MISLSNIVYGYYVQEDETDRVVINSNKLFGERMEKLQREREKAAEAAFEASAPEVRTEPVLDEEGNPVLDKDKSGNTGGSCSCGAGFFYIFGRDYSGCRAGSGIHSFAGTYGCGCNP